MIVSALAGTLDVDPSSGFFGEVTLNDSGEILDLHIFEEVSADPELLGGVGAVLDRFRNLATSAKAALRALLAAGVDEDVLEFIRFHAEDLDDLDDDLRGILSAFVSEGERVDDVVESFLTRGLVFHAGDDGGLECWIDLSLAPDQSDEVLCVRFDANRNVAVIDWES